MTADRPSSSLLEKKRNRIRQQLHRGMNDRAFRQRVASHIRAIRYLRLRNQELSLLDSLVRLHTLLGPQMALKTGIQSSFDSRLSHRPKE
ncbi:hypothetical protein IV203_017163 [Nitzschia inconspicua]|uniref:Uncharacterized protein n=1 Tax=Nitzschia inconspicua TaxID=303405 RepID=A0A9K3KR51_9STRA|nr:hypothetical protein IV203_017163 [Nitzschia inconspicua]